MVRTEHAAFEGGRLIARGSLREVALAARGISGALVFDAAGRVVDLDLRGDAAAVAARYAEPEVERRGVGRPKLGVVAREVTLLPRHWEWLGAQPGGASAALRRLVDAARTGDAGRSDARAALEAAYRFMSVAAGDLPGFEEASRALFAGDRARFRAHAAAWPADVRDHAQVLGWPEGA